MTGFEDMKDDLDFSAKAHIKTTVLYKETCKKCGGTGRWYAAFSMHSGNCFACGGKGFHEFKTSPEYRAKRAAKVAQTKANAEAERRQASELWHETNPEMSMWVREAAPRFDFAASMLEAISKWGRLTENQQAAVQRCMQRDAERKAQWAAKREAEQPAGPVRLNKLHDVLQRHAKFYAGDITISRRNGDQLCWIKHKDADKVLGKIDGGVLTLWNRAGVDLQPVRDILNEFEGAPLQTAMKYGKLAGRCCSCGRELTDDRSIEAGIGPVCAEKF